MSVEVRNLEPSSMNSAFLESINLSDYDKAIMLSGFQLSKHIYIGRIDTELACIWGICSPTILSTKAGIWMYTTPLIKQHPFIFVRHSQLVVEKLLTHYETIEGETHVRAEHSKRWLRWLGAQFATEHVDGRIAFVIRRK